MFSGKIMLHTEIWSKFDEIAIVFQNLLFFPYKEARNLKKIHMTNFEKFC